MIDIRSYKGKQNHILEVIRTKIFKQIKEQMNKDQEEYGTEAWKSTIHSVEKIDVLNFMDVYITFAMKSIDQDWTNNYPLYKSQKEWYPKTLKIHKCKIKRFIVLEVIEYLNNSKTEFLHTLEQ